VSLEEHVTDNLRKKPKIMSSVHQILSQIEAIEHAIMDEISDPSALHLITSTRGAIGNLMAQVIEEHIRMQVAYPSRKRKPKHALAVEELIEAVHHYLK
jgi:DNA-binding FrmR family transcriptional regulator